MDLGLKHGVCFLSLKLSLVSSHNSDLSRFYIFIQLEREDIAELVMTVNH